MVMVRLTRFVEGFLKLQINAEKSAVAPVVPGVYDQGRRHGFVGDASPTKPCRRSNPEFASQRDGIGRQPGSSI